MKRKNMRTLILMCLLGLLPALGQTSQHEPNAADAVRRMLSQAPNGLHTSWDERRLCKLGDAAAVEVTRQIEGKDLSSGEIKQILLIIQFSFEAPLQIKEESDRRPQETRLLLDRLEILPASSGLKEDFDGTRKLLKRASR